MGSDNIGGRAVVIVLVLVSLLAYGWHRPTQTFAADGTDLGWDAAVHRSQTAHKPTLVIYTASWCGTCGWMHENVLSRDDIQTELQKHYTLYTVDLSNPPAEVQAHANQYGVHAVPTLIRYDATGKETARMNAAQPYETLAWLKAGE